MKRSWNSGRKPAIERKARRENARMIEELRWLLDGRDSKIRALEGRLRKVETQNVELTRSVLDTCVSVSRGRLEGVDAHGSSFVWNNEKLVAVFDFNGASFPTCLVRDIVSVARATEVLMSILAKKVSEHEHNVQFLKQFEERQTQSLRNPSEYARPLSDGLDGWLPDLPRSEREAAETISTETEAGYSHTCGDGTRLYEVDATRWCAGCYYIRKGYCCTLDGLKRCQRHGPIGTKIFVTLEEKQRRDAAERRNS